MYFGALQCERFVYGTLTLQMASISSSDTRADRTVAATGPKGEVAHRDLIEHSDRFARRLYEVREGVWCYVGGGVSNISFLSGPDGLVAIDSGESVEEAAEALAAVREHTAVPVVGVIYSHFHYVSGTAAFVAEADSGDVEIWAHEDLEQNRAAMGAEVGPMRMRGPVSQMGIQLPTEGPDAMPNIGIGPFWRDPARAASTPGFMAPTNVISGPTDAKIGGLTFELVPIPSDSEDTLVIWVPDLDVCVNNHVWPALFNVYPLRGEPYRDPLVRIQALDHILALEPEHLVGVHGPPISGRTAVQDAVAAYRDAIQFLWDQTVRGMNLGMSLGELVEFVQLPDRFASSYLTTEFYGMVPHHVRQIHNGVRGWFDGDAANLFPLPQHVEAERIVEGFGGRDSVLAAAADATDGDELRWAAQLATYLLRLDPADAEAVTTKASALRGIAQSTTSANVRSFCLTQALELEGTISLDRLREPHASRSRVLSSSPETYVHALRVQLDPAAAAGVHHCVQWRFDDGTTASLRVRDGVAVPGAAVDDANTTISLSLETWADLYSGKATLDDAVASGELVVEGDTAGLRRFFGCFDNPHLR